MSASSSSTPTTITLSNGVKVPLLGFGCAYGNWTVFDGSRPVGMFPEQAYRGLASALRAGFRHFDGAVGYGTEKHLGYSLAPYFTEGKIKREDLFLTSKYAHPGIPGNALYMSSSLMCHPSETNVRTKIMSQFDKTCENLGIGSLDLALIHWPNAFDGRDEKDARRHRLAVWSTFEELYNLKQIRAIGVANFSQKHIEQLIEDGCKIVPMVNQLELHPYCQQPSLVEFCRSKGIAVEAYSPFGSGAGAINLFVDPVLTAIAKSHNRTVSQIILRWLVQQNIIALPRSSSPEHCQENFDVFSFELTSQEMEQINKLDANKHTCPDPANLI